MPGIASGFPVGATIATEEVANAFTGLTISTFGGSPITMSATSATLDVMEREDVRTRSAERGRQLRTHLLALKDKYPVIGDVRGMGLMQGVELVEDRKTKVMISGSTPQCEMPHQWSPVRPKPVCTSSQMNTPPYFRTIPTATLK